MVRSEDARIKRALISVSDKTAIVDFCRFLAEQGVGVLSTGGSGRMLTEAGVTVTEVSAHTGFPEILDGRVKTLHPLIHGGILGRRDCAEHVVAMERYGIAPIDLVVVNLYPFEETVLAGADDAACVENIDIGGPALIRAAAKNCDHVTVVTRTDDYAAVVKEMRNLNGATTLDLRRHLARTAFAYTAAYDAAIAQWMTERNGEAPGESFVVAGWRIQALRYGENPHQRAALYRTQGVHGTRPGVVSARQLQGKDLSYNNITDAQAAFELVCELSEPAVAIVKHTTPCGVAKAQSLAEAYAGALACDPKSAFGGVVALNRPLDQETAKRLIKLFTEVVITPQVDPDARAALNERENLRVLETGGMPDPALASVTLTGLSGGFLVQDRDSRRIGREDLRVVTKRHPSDAELADLLFAFQVVKHVKSNAIVFAKDGATVGIGAGQMSRVDAARLAVWKARESAREAGALATTRITGSVIASDAFLPFADTLSVAIEEGATAAIQPGGAMRDEEVIATADEAGVAMVFTGVRHFRH